MLNTFAAQFNRMKLRRHRKFFLCTAGICVFLLLFYYKTLHHKALLRRLPILGVFFLESELASSFGRNRFPNIKHSEGAEDVLRQWMKNRKGQKNVEPHKQTFILKDDHTPFFILKDGKPLCFREGTTSFEPDDSVINHTAHQNLSSKLKPKCVCREGWHGPNCGIPTVVQHSNLPTKSHLRPRKVPRRIINAININHEFDLLHARFHELADAVDLFLVCESNYTAYGDPKPLTFLRFLLNGTFDYVKDKILYIFLDHFPKGGRVDGWIADDYLRTFLSKTGMLKVSKLRPDDVFVLNDADEIPLREGVMFLKLYDGWTEPFGIHMRKSLYGFFWKQPGTLDILSGCTVAMLLAVYRGDGILLRRRNYFNMPDFRDYEKKSGHVLIQWSIGSPIHYAGWHCSWCFRPEGIYHKLVSAQNGDFPRWGDFVEKRKLSYITDLIRYGGWFDGSVPIKYPPANLKEHMFAPNFFLRNYERHRYLLENPYIRT